MSEVHESKLILPYCYAASFQQLQLRYDKPGTSLNLTFGEGGFAITMLVEGGFTITTPAVIALTAIFSGVYIAINCRMFPSRRLSYHNFFECVISNCPATQWGHEFDFPFKGREPIDIYFFETPWVCGSWRQLYLGKQYVLYTLQVRKAWTDEAQCLENRSIARPNTIRAEIMKIPPVQRIK